MNCLNCEKNLSEMDSFCPQCGSKVISKRLTFKNYISEFSNSYLRVDNLLFKTIKTLFLSPNLVVNGYINGLRKKYIDPFRFLLTTLFFAGIYVFLLRKGYLGDVKYESLNLNENDSVIDQKEFMPQWLESIYDYNNLIMFLTIPLLAIISKIVFYNLKKFNLVEHFIIYTYTYSFSSLIGFLPAFLNYFLQFDIMKISYFNMLLYFGYHIFALKNIFQLNSKQIFLKSLLFILVFVVFFTAIILLITLGIGLYLAATGKIS